MACATKRRGKHVIDVRLHGKRVVKVFRTRREADAALASMGAELRQKTRPAVDPFVALKDYAPRFLADCQEQEVVSATQKRYRQILDNHILPTLGKKCLRDICRADIRTLLLSKRQEGVNLQGQKGDDRTPKGALSRATVAQIRSVLSSVLNLAVEDEVLTSNPALGLSRRRRTKAARIRARVQAGDTVKAMDLEQRNRFLAVAAQQEAEVYPAFMLMALGGLRLGETLGLKWSSVDLQARRLRIHEQLGSDTTKTGTERNVDMAAPLVDLLSGILARRREEGFRSGKPLPPRVAFTWVSEKPDAKEQQKAEKRVRRAMERVLKLASLPQHFTPHALRHTFCSLLIASSVSPVYVQQQAGHASVEMTVGVYGSWFAVEAPGAMDRLAVGVPGGPVVTNLPEVATSGDPSSAQPLLPTGTSGRPSLSRPFPG
jgi:integrase